jgi:hypothetical protein
VFGALLLGPVVLGACGNGKDEPAAPVFKDAADAVCARYDSQLAALTTPSDRETAAVLLDKVVAIDGGRVGELASLVPPAGSGPRKARLLEAQRRVLEATTKAADALRGGENEEYAGLVQDAAEAVRTVRSEAGALRLSQCAAYRSRVSAALIRLPLPAPPPKETTTVPADTVPADTTPADTAPEDTVVADEAPPTETTAPAR